MNIVVCAKQVPDTDGPIKVNARTQSIDDNHVKYVVNSFDKIAIEEAVLLKESFGSGQVTVFSLGESSVENTLRKCLAQGADRAVLVSDPAFIGADSLRTGSILATAIKRIPFDLILCGAHASDTNSGQVGAMMAEVLGIPLISAVTKIEISKDRRKITVQRKLDRGDREIVEVGLPALLTIELGAKPRYATVRYHLSAQNKDIDCFDAAMLGLIYEDIGTARSKTTVLRISPPKPKAKLFSPPSNLSSVERTMLLMKGGVQEKEGNFLEGNPEEVAIKLIDFLKSEKHL